MKMVRLAMRSIALFLMLLTAVSAGELSNRRAPGFSLPDMDLKQHDLYDLRGKVVLLEVMKTDCPLCGIMASVLEDMKKKYGDRIAVLSVVIPPDTQLTVRAFRERHKLTYPTLFDCGQMASSYLKVSPSRPRIHLPHLFLIDKEGMIRDDWQSESAVQTPAELTAEIEKYLK